MKRGGLVALGVFAALFAVWLLTRETTVSVGVKKLSTGPIDVSKVSRIDISGAATAALVRDGTSWKVDLAGKTFPADESSVKAVLDAAAPGVSGEFMSDRADKQADTETSGPKALTVKFTRDGAQPLTLVFGRGAQSGGAMVRRDGENDIFVTKSSLGWAARRGGNDFRKRQFLPVTSDTLSKVTFTKSGASFTAVKADGTWKADPAFVAPKGFTFDTSLLAQLNWTVGGLSAVDFYDGAGSRAGLGLESPSSTLALESSDGKQATLRVGRLGTTEDSTAAATLRQALSTLDTSSDGKLSRDELKAVKTSAPEAVAAERALAQFDWFDQGAFALAAADGALGLEDLGNVERMGAWAPVEVSGDSQVYFVAANAPALTRLTAEDFRDLSLFDFDASRAQSVTFTHEGKKVVAQKTKGTWKVIEPKAVPKGFTFDTLAVENHLASLRGQKALRRLEGKVDSKASGLSAPKTTLEVVVDGKAKHVLHVGDERKKGSGEYFAKGPRDGAVYVVSGATRELLTRGIKAYEKVEAPQLPPGANINGLDQIPPEIRAKLLQSLKMKQSP